MDINEFIKQYAHTWRVFEAIVNDFDETSRLETGRGAITPVRLALHILQSTKYYLEDKSTIVFDSGKPFDVSWENATENELPSQTDIVTCIHEMQDKTEEWLSEMDFGAENKSFPWAGETKLGVVIFVLRHSLYHIGELSSLLNESRNGVVEDHYVKTI
jgi:uncharacterized damage-inducible protein DinB